MSIWFIRFFHYFKKVFLPILLVSVVVPQCILGVGVSGPGFNFDVKKKEKKEGFIGFYYNLVKRGHFSPFYPGNMIISVDVDYNFPENGVALLMLIEWLCNDDRVASRFLLSKLNKYFYLDFHSFLSSVEVNKRERAEMYSTLHFLSKYVVRQQDGKSQKENVALYPFRTVLSKMIISIYIVLYSELRYHKQREILVYYLEKLKKELMAINYSLKEPIDSECITKFILLLEAHVVQEPVVKKTNVKRALIITAMTLSIATIVGYIVYKGGFKWLQDRVYDLSKKVGDGLADSMMDRLKEDAPDIGRGLAKGIATEDQGEVDNPIGPPNRHASVLGREVGEGIIYGAGRAATYPIRATLSGLSAAYQWVTGEQQCDDNGACDDT